jgi:hypothetical protein
MNGVDLEEALPEPFLAEAMKMGMEGSGLRGYPRTSRHCQNEENRVEMERVVHYIKKSVLPRIRG